MNLNDTAAAVLALLGIALMTALALVPLLLDHDAEKRVAPVVPLRPEGTRGHPPIGALRRAA